MNGVPDRPLLKPWYRIARGDDNVVLEYGQAALVFEGAAASRLLPALLPLLDGERTFDEIVAELGTAAAPAVEHAVGLLARRGLLTDPPGDDARGVREAFEFLAASSPRRPTVGAVARDLEAVSIGVRGVGRTADDVARLLVASGVGEIRRGDGAADASDLVVAAPAARAVGELEEWSRRALELRVPWLQVLPYDGRYVALGPLFVPHETCCYECFRIRRASNSPYREAFWPLEEDRRARPSGPFLACAAAALAAALALRWVLERDPSLPGVLYALEFGEQLRLTQHHVYRVPRCASCSPAVGASPQPWFDEVAR